MRAGPWTEEENNSIVRTYFEMLAEQCAGRDFKKADYRKRVEKETGRSKASVEFKFCNISAVLEEEGRPFVQGYAPFSHYQQALKDTVKKCNMF